MASEARRSTTRIIANYARLLASVAMGLLLVPVQLAWLGNDGFGLLALIGASVGLAAILQDVMRNSLVRELGAAWHDTGRAIAFPEAYASAFVLCLFVAVMTAAFFTLAVVIIPVLKLPEQFITPARWILGAEGVATCLLILCSPTFNMYVVTERFVAHNFWTAARRAVYLAAALLLFLVFKIEDPARGLTWFGITTAGASLALLLAAVVWIVVSDRRLIPRFGQASTAGLREVAGTFGWNSSVVLAMNLHERVGAIIMNQVFGLWGNTIFGLALRLVSYVRMATLGMTFGLDAVGTRLASGDDEDRLLSVTRYSTRLHAAVAIPGAVAVWLLAEPMLRLWVGRYVQDPDPGSGLAVLATAEVLVKIMAVGLACRAIADGWMKLMYGAGHIRRYAPLVFAGGLANPLIALLLIWLLPEPIKYTGAAWGLTLVFLIVHLGLLPLLGGSALGASWWDLMSPLIRPTLITLVSSSVLLIAVLRPRAVPMDLPELGIVGVVFGLVYAVMTACFGLQPRERQRIGRAIDGVLSRRGRVGEEVR